MTYIGDIVLIYFENQPTVYARVEDIQADVKKDWYHLSMRLLQVPEAEDFITWILKDSYINGEEFKMQGQSIRLEKLKEPEALTKSKENKDKEEKKSKVITLADFKK